MSDDKIDPEEFGRRVERIFKRLAGRGQTSVKLGNFTIDHVQDAGTWVYKKDYRIEQIFSISYANGHANIAYDDELQEALEEFQRLLILEELANI